MNRARETRCLFQLEQHGNFYNASIDGDFLVKREGKIDANLSTAALAYGYPILGMEDIDLSFAGRRSRLDPIHERLSQLETGDRLTADLYNDKMLLLVDDQPVAALSKQACKKWRGKNKQIERLNIIAMVNRTLEDSGEVFRERCRVKQWEIPLVEIIYKK